MTPIPLSVKIVVAGGFGVGKSTFVGSISEIDPLRTEEVMTRSGEALDVVHDGSGKTSTTVGMDFGRVTLPRDRIVLYLFGTPGQERFHFMWDELSRGAIGAVVLCDTSRLDQSFAAVDYFEARSIPFVVGINCFHGVAHHGVEDVRSALALAADVPMLLLDARRREHTRHALLTVVRRALAVSTL
ncbi:MAG: ATP/GTP-binding protein [Microthrixaceae bacterium]